MPYMAFIGNLFALTKCPPQPPTLLVTHETIMNQKLVISNQYLMSPPPTKKVPKSYTFLAAWQLQSTLCEYIKITFKRVYFFSEIKLHLSIMQWKTKLWLHFSAGHPNNQLHSTLESMKALTILKYWTRKVIEIENFMF